MNRGSNPLLSLLRVDAAEVYEISNHLRWNDGVLEQAWVEYRTRKIDWRPVPQAKDTTNEQG